MKSSQLHVWIHEILTTSRYIIMKSQQLQRYSHGTSAEDRDEIIHMKYLCIVTTLNQRNHETSTAADMNHQS